MLIKVTPLYGTTLEQNPMAGASGGSIIIPGLHKGKLSALKLDESILSKHIMLIGGTGCGKSNVFYHIVSQIKKNMSQNDIMMIFDTKGDYYNLFAEPGDHVIGNSAAFFDMSAKWNIFREILADGWDDRSVELNAQEISWSIFRESINKSKDPFFPNAARDLFAAIILCVLKKGKEDAEYKKASFFNCVYWGTGTTQSVNINVKRENIVKPEEILRLNSNEVYVFDKNSSEISHTNII